MCNKCDHAIKISGKNRRLINITMKKHAADLKENVHKYYQEHKETVHCRTAKKNHR